ncbi:TetR family transcriptional regulator [soil metagenome]
MAGRDPDEKRRRLIEAGFAEFAAYGIAGARIDRIAKAADCSAGLVYTNFGSKDELFTAVVGWIIERTIEEAPITPDDLPGYAGRLFDAYEAHPEVARFLAWQRLEGGPVPKSAAAEASTARKIELIADAQRRGTVPDRFSPVELLGMVIQLAAVWNAATPQFTGKLGKFSRAQRRQLVTESVAALLESGPSPT